MNNLAHLKILKNKYVDIVLLCLFLLPTFMLMNYNIIGNQIIKSNQDRTSGIINSTQEDIRTSNGYQLVDPINITTESDWALYPFITGNGSESNPYIIENVEIIGDGVKTMESGNDTLLDTSDVGIFIGTSASFIIRNCKISHTSIGIHLTAGFSSGDNISNVEISDCSLGIYSKWYSNVSISNCYIHDCNWVSIKAKVVINYFLDYGGVGIWVRSSGGIIEDCRIEDCSIGMIAGRVQVNRYNEFINCGFVPDWVYMFVTDYDNTNTVNGKPIGIFWGIDNLVFTNASQYGQLIFACCANLTLSNIHITEPCSIGIQILSLGFNQTTNLNNIICENQNLGMYVRGSNIFGNNLYAKNCEAGFYFDSMENSEFTRIMTENTDIPIYMTTETDNFTIEIEKSTKIYLVDWNAWYWDILDVVPGNDITMSYITELGSPGYIIQFNDFGTYQLNLTLIRDHHGTTTYLSRANLTVISVPRYPRPDISKTVRDYPYFLIWSVIVIGLLLSLEFYRRFYQK
jgi:hypothetical protein